MPTFKKMLAVSAPAEDKTAGTAAESILEPLSVAAGCQAEYAQHTEKERRELEMAEAVRQADELREQIDAEEADSSQLLPAESSPASDAAAAPELADTPSEIPFAEVSEEYSGQWVAESGEVVAWIRDGKMKGALGTAVDLIIRSRDTCMFELGGKTHTGKLGDDGKLSWSHGGIWTRKVRGINKQATIQRTTEQPKPVAHRNIEEHRERLSFPTHVMKLWDRTKPAVEQPECKPQKSREEQLLEDQQRKAFEDARALSEAGIAKAQERREEERIRKATAKERARKAKEFNAEASPGMRVRVCGLFKRKDMNDQLGELVQWNEENERWQVEMDNGSGSKLFKSENLEVVDMGEEGVRKCQAVSEEDEEQAADDQWTAEEWAAWEKQSQSVTVD